MACVGVISTLRGPKRHRRLPSADPRYSPTPARVRYRRSSDSVRGFDESLTGEYYEAPRMGLPGIIA